jgi:hypothetical protein
VIEAPGSGAKYRGGVVGELLTIVSVLSVGVGPFVSDKVPAMPPDLRSWALWVSGVAAGVAWVITKVRLKAPVDQAVARRYLTITGICAVFFAVLYLAIALVWKVESGDWRDIAFQIAAVTAYSLCFACVTAVATAGEALAK